MQSQWISEFILIAHAAPGDPQKDPRKCDRRDKEESDTDEQKYDFGSHLVFVSPL